MKKKILLIILSLVLFNSFSENSSDIFINAWGDTYSEKEINFIREFDGEWIPIDFLDWYKNKKLHENAERLSSDFSLLDLESIHMFFIKDVILIAFPYGIKTYEVTKIEKRGEKYDIELSANKSSDTINKNRFVTDIWKNNYDTVIFSFEFNNRFLLIRDNNRKKIQKYLKISIENLNILLESINSGQNNGINYFDEILTGQEDDILLKNQITSAKENLKLRSGEATSSTVLTVLSAGTKVKILTLGKQATIDGITGNWVQVEVLADAKDRDGKPIDTGTVGWCFGGYLE